MSDGLKVEPPEDMTLSDAEEVLEHLIEQHNQLVDSLADVEKSANAAHQRANNLVGEIGELKESNEVEE